MASVKKQESKNGRSPLGRASPRIARRPVAGEQRPAARVEVDDKNVVCLYANFCRVTGTPEELILDFGLNAQPFGVVTEPVEVKQRIVTNHYTAKRHAASAALVPPAT